MKFRLNKIQFVWVRNGSRIQTETGNSLKNNKKKMKQKYTWYILELLIKYEIKRLYIHF